MKNIALALGITAVLVLAFLAYKQLARQSIQSDDGIQVVEPDPEVIPEEEPFVDTTPEAQPLPPAEPQPEPEPQPLESQQAGNDYLRENKPSAQPNQTLDSIFDYDDLISKAATATDLVYRDKNPISQMPFIKMRDRLMVERRADGTYLSARNYQRYEKWVKAFESVDVETAAGTYVFLKNLVVNAYDQLGMAPRGWEETYRGAVEKVMAMEVGPDAPQISQAGKIYIFVDNSLESLSPTHKALIRMGPVNTARIKAKLGALDAAVKRREAQKTARESEE